MSAIQHNPVESTPLVDNTPAELLGTYDQVDNLRLESDSVLLELKLGTEQRILNAQGLLGEVATSEAELDEGIRRLDVLDGALAAEAEQRHEKVVGTLGRINEILDGAVATYPDEFRSVFDLFNMRWRAREGYNDKVLDTNVRLLGESPILRDTLLEAGINVDDSWRITEMTHSYAGKVKGGFTIDRAITFDDTVNGVRISIAFGANRGERYVTTLETHPNQLSSNEPKPASADKEVPDTDWKVIDDGSLPRITVEVAGQTQDLTEEYINELILMQWRDSRYTPKGGHFADSELKISKAGERIDIWTIMPQKPQKRGSSYSPVKPYMATLKMMEKKFDLSGLAKLVFPLYTGITKNPSRTYMNKTNKAVMSAEEHAVRSFTEKKQGKLMSLEELVDGVGKETLPTSPQG